MIYIPALGPRKREAVLATDKVAALGGARFLTCPLGSVLLTVQGQSSGRFGQEVKVYSRYSSQRFPVTDASLFGPLSGRRDMVWKTFLVVYRFILVAQSFDISQFDDCAHMNLGSGKNQPSLDQ